MTTISIVMPALNEGKGIVKTIQAIPKQKLEEIPSVISQKGRKLWRVAVIC